MCTSRWGIKTRPNSEEMSGEGAYIKIAAFVGPDQERIEHAAIRNINANHELLPSIRVAT